jgi:ATP-binding cassette subfamily B protein
MRTQARLLGYLRPHTGLLTVSVVAMLLATGLSIVGPAILGWVIDVGLAAAPAEEVGLPGWLPVHARIEQRVALMGRSVLGWAALMLVLIGLLQALFSFVQSYFGSWVGHRATYTLRNQLYDHIQRLSFSFHDRTSTGDLMSRAITDIGAVQSFIADGMLDIVFIPLLFGGVSGVMLRRDPQLALIALAPTAALILAAVRFHSLMAPRFRAVQDQLSVISTRAQENLTGIRVVQAFAREPHEIERFEEANRAFLESRIGVILGFATYFPLMTFIVGLSTLLILWFGGRAVLAGETSLGTVVAFNVWVVMLADPTQRLAFLINRMSEANAGADRVFEILDTPPAIADSGARQVDRLQGRVEFHAVDFSYQDRQPAGTRSRIGDEPEAARGPLALSGIDFVAQPNQIVALFGPTGSGKSSVINLIPRFYDVTRGAVLVDGLDVRELSLDSLRRQVGIVLQDTFLFSLSVRDNIAYGRPHASQDEIEAAARAARAHDFVVELPNGYDTIIGERGVSLSGGQRQRIAIARAVLMRPRILILDDATSSVDPETEHLIQAALSDLMRGRTTFVIAQRLTTLRGADMIVVMEHGRIVERGRHDDLVAAGGLYARMYELQLRPQEELAGLEPNLGDGYRHEASGDGRS